MPTESHSVFDSVRPLPGPTQIFEKFLLPDEIDRVWADAAQKSNGASIFENFLKGLRVDYECAAEELSRVPSQGRVVVVANHPFGLVEGAILGALLLRVRSDVKFMANFLLAGVPELRDYLIPVDPFAGDTAVRSNWKPLRRSLEWLAGGGLLVTFPAGEVSSLQLPKLEITDPVWNDNVARLIQISGASSIPAFFHGTNGPGFQIAGLIHPVLRTALLPRELLNKKGRTIRVSIGRPIAPQCLAQLETVRRATDYLWQRTHHLQARGNTKRRERLWPRQAPVAGAVEPATMRAEVEHLPPSQRLIASGEYLVSVATASQIRTRCGRSAACARSPSGRLGKELGGPWIWTGSILDTSIFGSGIPNTTK
jgi:putative hemolysin